MLCIALLSIIAVADKTEGIDTPPTEIPVVQTGSIGELFDKYKNRLTVVVDETDFRVISDKSSVGYEQLLTCSVHLFNSIMKPEDRYALFLLDGSDTDMIEDADKYLHCTTRPCYAVERTKGEEDESLTESYTEPIGFTSGGSTDHNFLESCKEFVNNFLAKNQDNTLAWVEAPLPEADNEDHAGLDEEFIGDDSTLSGDT
eukprot:GEMP01070432.1.p1 GENE.GEMP01070432.1~~GEMP01070432.1.p1  ORF type:complete len:201 (+),score=49.03 GEMP01070432.1:157-759(+)